MDPETRNKLLNKKNIITVLGILIILLMIPITMRLLGQTQIFRSGASTASEDEAAIQFPDIEGAQQCNTAGVCTTSSDTVTINLVSTLGPPMPASQSGSQ